MSMHRCGAVLPNNVGAYVEHLAHCPKTRPEHAAFCQAIVNVIAYDIARDERSRNASDLGKRSPNVQTNVRERSSDDGERSCERCGRTFVTANVRKRFCSTACRSGHYRERSGGTA